jgi:hypothetical protein
MIRTLDYRPFDIVDATLKPFFGKESSKLSQYARLGVTLLPCDSTHRNEKLRSKELRNILQSSYIDRRGRTELKDVSCVSDPLS